jgi:hypothetical protein
MIIFLSMEFGWITVYEVIRFALGLSALGLLAWTVWGRARSQRDFFPLAAVLSVLWWMQAGRGDLESEGKFVAASLAAFAIGTVFGFVFSSTMGESDSVGKVRDWLVGGIAALTVAQVASGGHTVKQVLGLFVPQGRPDDLAIVAGMAVVYSVTGFFLMFFNRELILNLLLVKGRVAARDAFERSAAAAGKKIVEAFGEAPGGLSWQTTAQQQPLELDPEVRGYVREVETRLRNGEKVDLDDIKKAAVVLSLGGENVRATKFLKLASQRNPEDEDLVMMLAKALAELGERDQAIAQLLEFKKRNPKAGRIDKILGFYYLWSPDKLKESIEFTSSYLEEVAPQDDGAVFNLACAYAQLYAQSNNKKDRDNALDKLKQAVSLNKVWKERAVELTGIDGDFVSLKDDPEFNVIVQK